MPGNPIAALRTPSRSAGLPLLPPAAVLRGVRGPALHGIDLDLAAGGRLALLGPTGAGKTAVLDVLAGFTRPAAGEVLLDGRAAAGLKPHRRRVGLVLRDDGPLAQLTIAGTIAFALAARRGAAEQERRGAAEEERRGAAEQDRGAADEDAAGAIMQALGLAGLGGRRAGDLSPEQRARAALARALAGRPRLLLLDEPFARLDAVARDAVLADLLPVLDASGAACVLATSDAALALALGGRVAVLEGGAVLQSGPAQALYDSPATARVALLLGEANCLPGRVERVEDDIARVQLACGLDVEAAAGTIAAGQPCHVFIRPERVAVAAGTAAEMGEGALPATVTELAWRGDQVRLTLSLGATTPARLVVTRPAGVPLAGLAPGAPAAVAWQVRHARVLV